ncbi:MAG: MBL fold metallo-hydrolase [Deltaproteobacteria bacterium]|nr:MBL fold metallo-hydrolase [Deltaproteobacteria bacterium]
MDILFKSDNHSNIIFSDFGEGDMIQSNQNLIFHEKSGLLIDPGGIRVYKNLYEKVSQTLPVENIKHIFLSHQDPDIVSSLNGWLMVTDATAYISDFWIRFITHFWVDSTAIERIKPIDDKGMILNCCSCDISIIPAHFLHSAGNFQVYDSESKILYTGDLAASFGAPYKMTENFETHIQYIEKFHKRMMGSLNAINSWKKKIENFDIDMIVPQHGAVIKGKNEVKKFIKWAGNTPCGSDLL